MKKFEVYKTVETIYAIKINANSKEEAEELAEKYVSDECLWTKKQIQSEKISAGESIEVQDDSF